MGDPQGEAPHLTCPYCRGELATRWHDHEHGNAVMACACGEVPVLQGVAWLERRKDVLMRESPARAEALEHLKRGDVNAALTHALMRSSQAKSRRFVTLFERLERSVPRFLRDRCLTHIGREVVNKPGQTFCGAASALRNKPYADYLHQRFANPSLLASIPTMLLLKELTGMARPRVLEIGGGTGHANFLMSRFFPDYDFTLTDGDFTNLYLAQRFLTPNSDCLCIDAEVRLPFADHSFDAVYCQDSFHYLTEKAGLLDELRRIVRPGGLWLFPHMHNSLQFNRAPGFPLSPTDYARLFSFLNARLYSDASLLRQFRTTQSIDLSQQASPEDLASANALTLIAGPDSLWNKHDFSSLFCKPAPDLALNPIYQPGPDGAATLSWPNPDLRDECLASEEFLPPSLQVSRALLERIRRNELADGDPEQINALIRQFVLVPLPPRYIPGQAESNEVLIPRVRRVPSISARYTGFMITTTSGLSDFACSGLMIS